MQIHSPRLAARIGSITLAPEKPDHIGEMIAHLEAKRYSPKTVRNYRIDLHKAERDMGKALTAATAHDLVAYMATMAREGLASSTIRRKQATLRQWAKWALKRGLIQADPTLDLEAPKSPDRLPIHLTDQQIAALLGVLGGDNPLARREAAIVQTLYFTGLRAGEVVGLDVASWRKEAGVLRVIGKGNRERFVPVPAALVAVLDAWLAVHPVGAGPMFCRTSGERLTYDAVRAIVMAAYKRAGLAGMGFTAHKLRHSYATRLVNRGLPIDRIQKLLGHKSITTTTVYAHTEIGQETREALDRML